MKSMKQMQDEMLSAAKWDGGYPRAVCMFPGIVALAYDEAQWKYLNRQNELGIYFFIGSLLLGIVAVIIWIIFS